jgi:hypothetical protein
MRIFERFNKYGNDCPICRTKNEGTAVLIAIDGTDDDGIIQAVQVHTDCIELRSTVIEGRSVIYMVIDEK